MLSLRVPLSSALPLKILLQLSCSGGAARGSFSAVVFRETPSGTSSSAAVAQSWTSRVVERGVASIEEKAARGRDVKPDELAELPRVVGGEDVGEMKFNLLPVGIGDGVLVFHRCLQTLSLLFLKRPSRTALALLNSGPVKMFMVMDAESQRWIAALADTYELRLYMSPPFVLTSTK